MATGALARIYRLADLVGPVGVGIAVSVVAYVVGLVSRSVFSSIYEAARNIAGIPFLLIGWFASSRIKGVRVKPERLGVNFSINSSNVFETIDEARVVMDELTARFMRDNDFRQQIRTHVSPEAMKFFCQHAENYHINIKLKGPEGKNLTLLRYWFDLNELSDREKVDKLIDAVYSRIEEEGEYGVVDTIEVFMASLILLQPLIENLEEDYSYAPERLVIASTAAYDRWDRLQAEADFRSAVVPPLVGLAAVLWFTDAHPAVPWALVAFCVVLLRMSSSLGTEARQQLLTLIMADVIESKTLAKIRHGNVVPEFVRRGVTDGGLGARLPNK